MRCLACVCMLLAFLGLISPKVIINSTALSTERSSVGSIQTNKKVFFAGGFDLNDKISSNIIDVYNLETNAWDPPMTLQHPRANLNPAVLGELTYFIGGNEYTNKPYICDEASSYFQQAATDPPSVRTIRDISLYRTSLTVVGKWNIDIFNIASGTWNSSEALHNIMASLNGPLVVAAEKYIFIIGGLNSTDQISELFYIFDVETNDLFNKTTTLQIHLNSTASTQIFHDFRNNVLVVSYKTTTLLYHVVKDELYHLDIEPLYSAVLQLNQTFLFPVSKTAIYLFRWTGATGSYETIFNGTFLHAFGNDERMGYVWFAGSALLTMYPENHTAGTSNSLNWGSTITGFDWPPNKYAFLDSTVLVVFKLDAGLLNQAFSFQSVEKIFILDDTLFVFTGLTGQQCMYTIQESIADFTRTNYECEEYPDLLFNDKFFYLASGKSRRWPFLDITLFEPLNNTADLLIAQTADQIVLMHQTPDVKLSGIIEVLNTTNNGTWLDPIAMPSRLLGDLENNIVVTSLNDTVLALDDTFLFQIDSTNDIVLIDSVGYPVTGNAFNYLVHSQLAVVIGHDVYMKSKNNSQCLYVYNNETGWRSTTAFPEIIEPKQLFVYNNKVIYMIALNVATNKYENVYYYDIESGIWQITVYKTYNAVTAAMIGDFLALFADNGIMYSLYIPTSLWIEEDIANPYLFSSVVQIPSHGLTFVSGAVSVVDGSYSSTVLILTDDGIVPVIPQSAVNNPSTQPGDNTLDDNTTLIVAIVVPVGAAVIGAALLAFFLVRRNKKRKHGNASSTVGLETKYGQWFTPFDQIKFGEQIGQGGNGQVFKGTWKNTTVALKVSMTQANSSVIAELELMMQLRPHPNVVQLFGFSVHPETNSIILIIEFCNQGSLDNTLFDNQRQIGIDDKTKWIASVAKGLSHLHSNNIVHRDVAARNILLNQNEPKITDFGMSRLVNDENQRGTTKSELGPIRWMAPEALRNKEYSTKSDVWSFGVLMYEIIAQLEPHCAQDPIEVGRFIRDNGLTPVIPDSCPTTLASIMKQCWSMNPDQRPSMEQILGQLDEH